MSLITTGEANTVLSTSLIKLATESVPISKAANRKLAEDLFADRPLPPYNRAMMDGVAFNANEVTQHEELKIQGLHAAGNPPPPALQKNHCWEIMTGACFPEDCDTLIPYEKVSISDTLASIEIENIAPGKYIHKSGSDYKLGDRLIPKGTFLGTREIAVAASIGASQLQVIKHPRIHIITTGDELVTVDEKPEPHQIRQSNGLSLLAAFKKFGFSDCSHSHIADDKTALTKELKESLTAYDLLLICGGISKGKKDYIRQILEQLMGLPLFHGISQRPGKPLAFWHQNNKSIFALPGNPVSTLVCFHRYVLPYLEELGIETPKQFDVKLAENFTFKPKLSAFIPATLNQEEASFIATLKPLQNSGDFATAVGTDGFVELPKDSSVFKKGTSLRFFPWL